MKIEEIDRNFKAETVVTDEDVEWISALDERFVLSGVYYSEDDGCFMRLPREVAASASDGVKALSSHSTGGRLRFQTDSPYIAIRAVVTKKMPAQHMTLVNQNGFSIYSRDGYHAMIAPTANIIMGSEKRVAYEGIKRFGVRKRDLTIYFPSYGELCSLFIGVRRGSYFGKPHAYKNEGKPVAFYGSSITMGGCASRPGTDYVAMACRDLGLDFLNFGFSGNCKGEVPLADYFASLPLSAFVYDYDHNAPSADYLEQTHEKFFLRLRELCPELPVLMMSRPTRTSEYKRRREIVRQTYENAIARGDKNVYYLDGMSFFNKGARPYTTVDEVHPNDYGFYLMARKVKGALRKIFKKG